MEEANREMGPELMFAQMCADFGRVSVEHGTRRVWELQSGLEDYRNRRFLEKKIAQTSEICASLAKWIGKRKNRHKGVRRGHPHFWTAKIPWMCPICPVEMSRLSRGRSVQSMWNYA